MSQVTVVEVPQWRSSGSSTAHRLPEGARLLADMIPDARHTRVEVEEGTSPEELAATAARVRAALDPEDFVVTVGGDCGVDLAPVAEARRRHGDALVLVWFDAHGDLNTPSSSPSGAFHGMVLRTLTGDGHAALLPDQAIDPRRVVLAGARDLDPGEVEFIEGSGMQHLTVAELADPLALVTAVAKLTDPSNPVATAAKLTGPSTLVTTAADLADPSALVTTAAKLADLPTPFAAVDEARRVPVYVHIDLDVLAPESFASVGTPAPGGLRPDQLLHLVTAVAGQFEVVGLGITEYEPARASDQDMLAPLVDALVKACR